MRFADRYGPWALVTGAARGLGEAFATELVRRGLSVLALDRDADTLAATVARLRGIGGVPVEAVPLDLTTDTLAADIADVVGAREVGLLVNNAATVQAGRFMDQDLGQLRQQLRVNCEAPLVLARVLGEPMRTRGRGGIVFVSSLSALTGGPVFTHYAATKAYDALLAEGLYEELRARGVDVTTVLGPMMDTPGLAATLPATRANAFVPTQDVVAATLEGLGRRARVIVGRDGHVLARVLPRVMSHERLRGLVAANLRKMYPNRG